MFALKWLLMAAGVAMFGTAAGVVAYDVYLAMQFQKLMGSGEPGAAGQAGPRRPTRWPIAMKLFAWAWAPLQVALSIVFVPEGSGGVRVGQISGVQQRTLYPGIHLIVPLVQRVAVYDLRDHLFTTTAAPDGRNFFASDVLRSAFAGLPATGNADEADQDASAPVRKVTQTAKIK